MGQIIVGRVDAGYKVIDLAPPPPAEILFGNSSITNADGTRSVVSEGTDTTAKLDLYSGQGLMFDGTQFFDTGFVPDLTKDFTLLWTQQKGGVIGGWEHSGTLGTVTTRLHFGINPDGVRVGLGNAVATVVAPLTVGDYYNLFMRYNASTKIVTAGIIGGATTTFTVATEQLTLPIYIGKINGTDSSLIGGAKDFYFIPYGLTDLELASHLQTPEQTLYYYNSVLKSGFLSQPIVDDIVAGNGFWYPLCENSNIGNIATDLAVSEAKIINNYTSSPMRDNATKLPYGLQTSLVKQDSNGVPTGIAYEMELALTAQGYSVPTEALSISGDFCIDIFVKPDRVVSAPLLSLGTDTTDQLIITPDGVDGSLVVSLGAEITSTPIPISGAIVSLERVGDAVTSFVHNKKVSSMSYIGAVTLSTIGDPSLVGFGQRRCGSFMITKTTRTEEQRLVTYNDLVARHILDESVQAYYGGQLSESMLKVVGLVNKKLINFGTGSNLTQISSGNVFGVRSGDLDQAVNGYTLFDASLGLVYSFEIDIAINISEIPDSGYFGYVDSADNTKRLSVETSSILNSEVTVEIGNVITTVPNLVSGIVVLTLRYNADNASMALYTNGVLTSSAPTTFNGAGLLGIGAVILQDGTVFKDCFGGVLFVELLKQIRTDEEIMIASSSILRSVS